MDRPDITRIVQDRLLAWFVGHRRPLPWRTDYVPYDVWIAEMMMQQTQMDRGVQYFLRWKSLFPDVRSVAEADEERLLTAWEGLGYYRRVRYIQQAARIVMDRHGGVFPDTYEAILSLPGIGPYTAGAIAGTAFNLPVPCVDGNVERVLSRVYDIDTPVRVEPAKSTILNLARMLIPKGRARDFNQALMELGALVCGRVPKCGECPLSDICVASMGGFAADRPVVAARRRMTKVVSVAVVFWSGERVLIHHRPKDAGLWAGLWEFPTKIVPAGAKRSVACSDLVFSCSGMRCCEAEAMSPVRHKYTTNDAWLYPYLVKVSGIFLVSCDDRWVTPSELAGYPMSAPQRTMAAVMTRCIG